MDHCILVLQIESNPRSVMVPPALGLQKKVDQNSFLDLVRIHLHRRTQSRNEWLHRY